MREDGKWLVDKYIAHRGYHSSQAAENSIAAFLKAIEEGFAIELDVHLLKDQELAVFHDDCLERMTGYKRKITECTLSDIRPLRLLNTKERIPLLGEVLETIEGKVPLMIEIKNKGNVGKLEEGVYKLLKDYEGAFVIQSFNPYSMAWFRKNAPGIIRGQLSGSYKEEEMTFYKKFILKNLLLNKISDPYFVNYEIDYLTNMPVKIKRKKGDLILGWTARNQEEYLKAMENCDNVVFEGFNPKTI